MEWDIALSGSYHRKGKKKLLFYIQNLLSKKVKTNKKYIQINSENSKTKKFNPEIH